MPARLGTISFIALCVSIAMQAQVVVQKGPKEPGAVSDQVWVVPGGWTNRIPPSGSVNAPGFLDALAPGQRIGLGVIAKGEGRDHLLEGRSLQVTITLPSGSVTLTPKAAPIRHIKAEGADMVLSVLKAGGISGPTETELDQATSLVSLMDFELPWEAPSVVKEVVATITLDLKGGVGPAPVLKPITLRIRPWSAWWSDSQPATPDLNAFMKGFHERPEPGRLLPMLKSAVRQKALDSHSVYGFFAAAFRSQPAARDAELTSLGTLEPVDQWAFLMMLKLGGSDVSAASSSLSADVQKSLQGAVPLADPPELFAFEDPVDPQRAMGLGVPMDQCWGGWMATGDSKYLKGLVSQLAFAPFLPDLNNLLKTKAGAAGLNAKVARGLAYRTAGWSLSSFQREDPQVADWIAYWGKDPSQPEIVRTQLGTLGSNPAFKQEK